MSLPSSTSSSPESSGESETDYAKSPVEMAREVALRYVSDHESGIVRKKRGKGFVYYYPNGEKVTEKRDLARIRSLAIPPAYTDVWICTSPRGHLQATGRDARGRKQYRYHPKWTSARDETKFNKMIKFGEILPMIRSKVLEDMGRPGLCKEKIVATVVYLLDTTLIRVGNEHYANENKSFGLTTLRKRHVEVQGSKISFEFLGKSRKQWSLQLSDRRVAKVMRQCQELPGQQLFKYVDQGETCLLDSNDVNEYLRNISGQDITAKDFRTWSGTVLAAKELGELGAAATETEAKRNIVSAIRNVAARLGNTQAICRKCYVHPDLVTRYLKGTLTTCLKSHSEKFNGSSSSTLSHDEQCVLEFLRSLVE